MLWSSEGLGLKGFGRVQRVWGSESLEGFRGFGVQRGCGSECVAGLRGFGTPVTPSPTPAGFGLGDLEG